jgi:hypothetical protein
MRNMFEEVGKINDIKTGRCERELLKMSKVKCKPRVACTCDIGDVDSVKYDIGTKNRQLSKKAAVSASDLEQ